MGYELYYKRILITYGILIIKDKSRLYLYFLFMGSLDSKWSSSEHKKLEGALTAPKQKMQQRKTENFILSVYINK